MSELTSFSLMDENRGSNSDSCKKVMTYSLVGLGVVHAETGHFAEEQARVTDDQSGRERHEHERCQRCEVGREEDQWRLEHPTDSHGQDEPDRKHLRLERVSGQEVGVQEHETYRCNLQELKVLNNSAQYFISTH